MVLTVPRASVHVLMVAMCIVARPPRTVGKMNYGVTRGPDLVPRGVTMPIFTHVSGGRDGFTLDCVIQDLSH